MTWTIGTLDAPRPCRIRCGGSVSLSVQVKANVPGGTVITNTAAISSAQTATQIAQAITLAQQLGEPIPLLGDAGLALLALLLAAAGVLALRRYL